jgi:hypothetical protein
LPRRRAQFEPGRNYRELDARHNPHITMPEVLAQVFEEITVRPA